MIQVIQGSLRCPAGRWWWVRLQHLDTRRHRRCSPYPGVSESPRNMGNMYCWYVDINNLDIHGEIFMENLEHDGDSMGIFQAFCSNRQNLAQTTMSPWWDPGSTAPWWSSQNCHPATVELELSPPDDRILLLWGKLLEFTRWKGNGSKISVVKV